MNHPSVLAALAAAVLVGAATGGVVTAHAAAADQKDVALRGAVTDNAGRPIASARVSAAGPLEFSTITNASGRYALTIRCGSVGALARTPASYEIEAKDGGSRIPVANGPAKLVLKLVALADSTGRLRIVASSGDAKFDADLNRQLELVGDGVAAVTLDFSKKKGGAAAGAAAAGGGAGAAAKKSPPPSARAGAVARSPAPASTASPHATVLPPSPASAAAAAPAARATKKKKDKEPLTALDLLEASKQTEGGFTGQRALDSAIAVRRAADDSPRRMQQMLDSLTNASSRRRHSFPRGTPAVVPADAPSTAPGGGRGFRRDAGAGAATDAEAPARSKGSGADSIAVARRVADDARRDSVRIAQRAQESAREATRNAGFGQRASQHDSLLTALRLRDSLRTRAHLESDARATARRDSARAASPPRPALDPHPPGTAAAADSCACRVRGTIEARTERPLHSPLDVTITVRGVPALASHVRLDMGSPREFTFQRVPCGARTLELAIAGGRRFSVITPDELRLDCSDGGLIQPRVAIKPN